MKIKSLILKNYLGFGFKLNFVRNKSDNGSSLLIGLNGAGKSTILNVIAGLSGNDFATHLISGRKVEYAKIVLIHDQQEYAYETMNNFDFDSIIEFKKTLPTRTSYILPDDYDEDRFVSETRDGQELFNEMRKFLTSFGVPIEEGFHVNDGRGAGIFMGQTSAQRYLFSMSFRKAPEHVPILLDYIERNVHVQARKYFDDFYAVSDKQQIIATSHCPFVLSSMQELGYNIIDLHDKGIKI